MPPCLEFTVSYWPEKHGKIWRVRKRVGMQKITVSPPEGYATKTAAKDAIAIMRSDDQRGESLVPRGGLVTVADFCAEWWEDREDTYTKVRSGESTAGVMDRYIVRLLGDYELGELESSPKIVQRWVNAMIRGETKPLRGKPKRLSPTTARNAHGLLHQIMDAAIVARLIRANPCSNTELPDPVEVEMMFLTPSEADRLIAAIPAHYRPLIVFLLATGCRWAEAIGLRAKNLDTLGRKVRILKQTTEYAGRFYDEDPKSKKGRRTLGFTIPVAHVLIPLSMVDDDRERRIFQGPRGGMITRKRFYKIWHAATEAAGLKGLRIHDLRHTHVAWLIAGNVPMSAISRRLGHKSYAVTDGRYGHLMEDMDERISDALTEIMAVIDLAPESGGKLGAANPAQPSSTQLMPAESPAQAR